jgi:hypothetical protein
MELSGINITYADKAGGIASKKQIKYGLKISQYAIFQRICFFTSAISLFTLS